MVQNFSQSIAYICQACGTISSKALSIFDFSGKKTLKLNCSAEICGTQNASIYEARDKYRISVECPFCGYDHDFSMSKSSFWSKDFVSFQCPVADMSIFYIGSSEKVQAEVENQENFLTELPDEYDSDSPLVIMLDIISELRDMFQEKLVTCECGSYDIEAQADENNVILVCRECGASLTIEPTVEEYERLTNSDILKIKK